jgi:serine/threonine protein kinase
MNLDRNLLFGLRALQRGFIDVPRFTEVYLHWETDQINSWPDDFVARGWLTADQRRMLERELTHGPVTASETPTPSGPTKSTELRRVMAVLHDSVQESPPPDQEFAGREATIPDALRYARLALHGKGGIGQVWRGFDRVLERTVAIKELQPEKTASAYHRDRFLIEARLTAQLDHPGIVPVHELVKPEEGERPFYTMRLIQGRTLTDAVHEYHARRRQGQASLVDLCELLQAFITVCNTLAYAHHRGVIHRDLKGGNIILGSFGEVLVLDWGMAKRFAEPSAVEPSDKAVRAGVALTHEAQASMATESFSDNATQPGEIMGTPGYMAPEQAAGRVDQFDPRTDIYGLGAVLYHLLTDRAPVTGSSIQEIVQKTLSGPLIPPRQIEPCVPKPLEAICLKALARAREDRYNTALELADEVKRWLADEAVHAFRDSLVTRAGRWMRRHRTFVTSSLAVLLVAFLLLGGTSVLLNAAYHAEQVARIEQEKQAKIARTAEETARRAEKKAIEERDAAARAEVAARVARKQAEDVTVLLVLATAKEDLGLREESLDLLDEAVRGWLRLDPEHPMVLVTLAHILMQAKDDGKRLDQALLLADEVLQIRRFDKVLDDPITINSANVVGAIYLKKNRPNEARRFLAEVLRGRRKLLPANDPETLHATYALALASLMADQHAAAEPLFQGLLTPDRKAQTPPDRVSKLLANLGECQIRLKKYAAAEANLREASNISMDERKERWRHFNIQRLLATSMVKQIRYQEAEPILLRAYDGLVKERDRNPYIDQLFLPETAEALVELFENTGQKSKAEQWKGKHPEGKKK